MSNIGLNTRASFLLLVGTLSQRLLGLASTLVLARLLTPEDFGLVALMWLVLRFANNMAVTGAQEYIIQKKVATREDLDTAWTINLAFKAFIIVVVLVATPYVAAHYEEPVLRTALPLLALVLVQVALVNPHLLMLRRERRYDDLFKIDVVAKAVSAVVTVLMAFAFRNYWALVAGHLVSASVRLVLSYSLFSYRPRLSLREVSSQLGFSQWMFLRGIFVYCRANVDQFLVADRFGAEQLGGYHVSKYIAMMPAVDAIGPATEPLFASFSSVQADADRLRYQVSFALLALLAMVLPLAAFVYVNSHEIVHILLGEKWIDYSPVFSVLSLAIVTIPLYNFATSILLVRERAREVFLFDLVTFALLVALLFLVPTQGLLEFTWLKISFDLVSTAAMLTFCLMAIGLHGLPGVLVLAVVTCAYTFLCAHVVSGLFADRFPSVVRLVLEGSVCLVLWGGYCQVVFQVIFRRTAIGHHIRFLESQHLRGFRFFSLFS